MRKSIGFDFDKIFVDYPPLIPDFIIDKLYKKKNHKLTYRFPSYFEQQLRIASHIIFLRQPLINNINALSKISGDKNMDIYLISGRFGFLKKQTNQWLKKYRIDRFFKKTFFNFNNEQPHLFKDRVLKDLGIEKFIDDDLDLLTHLAINNPKSEFYWLSKKNLQKTTYLPKNITQINDLNQFIEKHL